MPRPIRRLSPRLLMVCPWPAQVRWRIPCGASRGAPTMAGMPNALRLAVAQPQMQWTTAGNLRQIVESIEIAAREGARLCVFPELALTGLHRGIREQAVPSIVAPALYEVREACRANAIACRIGAPTFGDAGAVFDSDLHFDAGGDLLATVSKNGLTPSEQSFFQPGIGRPVIRFEGRSCTSVICREVEDLAVLGAQMRLSPVELIFWPSLVGHPPGTVLETAVDSADLGYARRAAVMARRFEAWVVQSNWPNALNTPGSSYLGESKVVAPTGEVLLTLPRDQAGVAVFDLGERAFHWIPLDVEGG